jgi:type IV pilus assembly protein PilN
MMIRINLLPVKKSQASVKGRNFLLVATLSVLGALAGNFFWYDSVQSASVEVGDKISSTDQQVKELSKVIGEVENINKRKKEMEDKLKVLADLRKGRSGPVRFLDALATATPKKVWIRTFEESANVVKLTGSAMSHEDVAEFMRSLQNIRWTPKGMGRLVEQKRDATTLRVELLGVNGAIEDFPVKDVGTFFSDPELIKTEQAMQLAPKAGASPAPPPMVEFELQFKANYAT